MKLPGNSTWQERADKVIAQGANTYSKRDTSYIRGVYQSHCLSGDGAHLTLADGNRVIDHTCGLGSNILSCRNNYGLPTTSEVLLAERLAVLFPFVDKFRFLKTGTAACECAIRIARAYYEANNDGKDGRGLGVGYHGSGNVTIAAEEPGAGCVDELYEKVADFDALIERLNGITKGEIAYVIIEPVQLEVSKAIGQQLFDIRQLCTEKDICLIFDEIICGFRVPLYSISNYFKIAPDIICFGKALGNGFPIAVVGARATYADTPDWFISNTHNGERVSICAALETLDYLTDDRLRQLWQRGEAFQKAFNAIAPDRIRLKGYATRAVWEGEKTYIAIFCQEAYRRGILLHPGAWWITFAHTDDLLKMELDIFKEIIEKIESRNIQLGGLEPSPVFKRNA